MNTYIIAAWYEFHRKREIKATSLEEAMAQFNADWGGLDASREFRMGSVKKLHFAEGAVLDKEGLSVYNEQALTPEDWAYIKKNYPEPELPFDTPNGVNTL